MKRWIVAAAIVATPITFGQFVADPGDQTVCISPAHVAVSGSGHPASPVEPDTACSQEVGR